MINNFELFRTPYVFNNKCFAIPELWTPIDWDDKCFQKEIKPFLENSASHDIYANDESLFIKDIKFFEVIKTCNFLTIFTAVDKNINISYRTNFDEHQIYKKICDKLIFIGWNPRCEIGSAFTDGLYPFYLEKGTYGDLCQDNNFNILVNDFGLINSLDKCKELCKINNRHKSNEDFWYPTSLYVDEYTYSIISKNII